MSDDSDDRRSFLNKTSNVAMSLGVVGGYGVFAFLAGRFLYPARPQDKAWTFVTELAQVTEGDSILFRTPAGETVNVTRTGRTGEANDFIALSSTCPHLGCQVHWEAQNDRYFCPCHNGVFDPTGKGIAGPPGDAGQSLGRYELRVDNGLLFMKVPTESLTAGKRGEIVERAEGVCGPGHDPCLSGQPRAGGDDPGECSS